MPRKPTILHQKIFDRESGDLLRWWNGLSLQERQAELQKQRNRLRESRPSRRAYREGYRQSPAGRESDRHYTQSEKGRATIRRNAQKPERVARDIAYRSKHGVKMHLRSYAQTPARKEYYAEYAKSERGKEASSRYGRSEKGRERSRRYGQSPKGLARYTRYRQRLSKALQILANETHAVFSNPHWAQVKAEAFRLIDVAVDSLPRSQSEVIRVLYFTLPTRDIEKASSMLGKLPNEVMHIEDAAFSTLKANRNIQTAFKELHV